jgi:UDP-N-acetyl-D-mannosaminuronic acid dehydrogenase
VKGQLCVIGLGHIGLPTACLLASVGYDVLGVDISEEVVARVQAAQGGSPEPQLDELLGQAVASGRLRTALSPAVADIHLIAVPTPLAKDRQADLSHVMAAADALAPHLRAEDLVLIESTCPIGATDRVAATLRARCPGVGVAYCPERVLPGDIVRELVKGDRIVGGIDARSTEQAVAFYRSFVRADVVATDARTAEAVKLAENTFRDINIAYANELSMIFDHLDLDVSEVIGLANRHPRVDILAPGPGVGGHCLAVDPWFLASAAPDIATLTVEARSVNRRKTEWAIRQINKAAKKKINCVIACFGLTYKPNASDLRNSPALAIAQALEKGFNVLRVDPHVSGTCEAEDALKRADVVVGLVAHRPFAAITSSQLAGKVILDFAGVFP